MATLGKYTLPDNLYYDRENHTWLRWDNGLVTVGLDMLGQESIGDMAYISLEAVGKSIRRAGSLGSLEAAKMVAPILAPISGKIVAVNAEVVRYPQLINTHPYTDGWLLVVEPSDWATESQELVGGAAQVAQFLADEVVRYREQGWVE